MIHTIGNASLSVSVMQKGAELCSIKSVQTGQEFMWDADPAVWGSFAPVLFPVIGALKNGSVYYADNRYVMPKHGIVRNNQNIECVEVKPDYLHLRLSYSDETLQQYPFKFEFNITFQLIGNKVVVAHKIKNLDDKTMYCSVGGHPAFKCPMNHDELYEDYYLEFEFPEDAFSYNLGPNGLLNGTRSKVLNQTNLLPLNNNLFNNDALIFKELKSRQVSLRSQLHPVAITMKFSDFDYLGVWAKPGGEFVCIEPWQGITDSFDAKGDIEKKEGMVIIPVGGQYRAQYSIEIEE